MADRWNGNTSKNNVDIGILLSKRTSKNQNESNDCL